MHFTYVIKEKVCHSSVICIFYTLPGKCKTKQNQLNKHKTRINPLCLLQKKERKKERNLVPILIGGEQCLILPTHLIQHDLNCGNMLITFYFAQYPTKWPWPYRIKWELIFWSVADSCKFCLLVLYSFLEKGNKYNML